jgi:hypothetical protein
MVNTTIAIINGKDFSEAFTSIEELVSNSNYFASYFAYSNKKKETKKETKDVNDKKEDIKIDITIPFNLEEIEEEFKMTINLLQNKVKVYDLDNLHIVIKLLDYFGLSEKFKNSLDFDMLRQGNDLKLLFYDPQLFVSHRSMISPEELFTFFENTEDLDEMLVYFLLNSTKGRIDFERVQRLIDKFITKEGENNSFIERIRVLIKRFRLDKLKSNKIKFCAVRLLPEFLSNVLINLEITKEPYLGFEVFFDSNEELLECVKELSYQEQFVIFYRYDYILVLERYGSFIFMRAKDYVYDEDLIVTYTLSNEKRDGKEKRTKEKIEIPIVYATIALTLLYPFSVSSLPFFSESAYPKYFLDRERRKLLRTLFGCIKDEPTKFISEKSKRYKYGSFDNEYVDTHDENNDRLLFLVNRLMTDDDVKYKLFDDYTTLYFETPSAAFFDIYNISNALDKLDRKFTDWTAFYMDTVSPKSISIPVVARLKDVFGQKSIGRTTIGLELDNVELLLKFAKRFIRFYGPTYCIKFNHEREHISSRRSSKTVTKKLRLSPLFRIDKRNEFRAFARNCEYYRSKDKSHKINKKAFEELTNEKKVDLAVKLSLVVNTQYNLLEVEIVQLNVL